MRKKKKKKKPTGCSCVTQLCHTARCGNGQCVYEPVTGAVGPDCADLCCGGACCVGQVCLGTECSLPDADQTTCEGHCGDLVNNCSQQVSCAGCPAQTCKTGTCTTENLCDYVNSDNNEPGPGCQNRVCCNGACCSDPDQICGDDESRCCFPGDSFVGLGNDEECCSGSEIAGFCTGG